jgi:hypothetical protein
VKKCVSQFPGVCLQPLGHLSAGAAILAKRTGLLNSNRRGLPRISSQTLDFPVRITDELRVAGKQNMHCFEFGIHCGTAAGTNTPMTSVSQNGRFLTAY